MFLEEFINPIFRNSRFNQGFFESLMMYRLIGDVFEQHFRGGFHEAIGFVRLFRFFAYIALPSDVSR